MRFSTLFFLDPHEIVRQDGEGDEKLHSILIPRKSAIADIKQKRSILQ